MSVLWGAILRVRHKKSRYLTFSHTTSKSQMVFISTAQIFHKSPSCQNLIQTIPYNSAATPNNPTPMPSPTPLTYTTAPAPLAAVADEAAALVALLADAPAADVADEAEADAPEAVAEAEAEASEAVAEAEPDSEPEVEEVPLPWPGAQVAEEGCGGG